MQYEGKIWPSETDSRQCSNTFFVPRSSLLAEEHIPGVRGFTVVETPAEVETRLKNQFPLYRLAKWGEQLIKRAGNDEV